MATKNFYRVRDGVFHGANNQFGPGSIVEMTEAEAAGLLDKLVLVEGGEGPQDQPAQEDGSLSLMTDERLVVSVPPKEPAVLPTEEPANAQAISKADVKEAVKGAESADGGSERGSGGGKRKV